MPFCHPTALLDAVHIGTEPAGELHSKLARRMSIQEQVVRGDSTAHTRVYVHGGKSWADLKHRSIV